MAHARRKLHDLFVARRNKVNSEASRWIGELRAIEAAIRGKPPDDRRRVRQEQARPPTTETARFEGRATRVIPAESTAPHQTGARPLHTNREAATLR